MTHPSQEDIISSLYGEASQDSRQAIEAHLAACLGCRAQYSQWQAVARDMDAWKLPARRKRSWPVFPFAAAASIALLAIAGGARMWQLNSELRQLRADLQRTQAAQSAQIDAARVETRDALASLAASFDQQRASDQHAVVTAISAVETKRAEQYAALRKELETVAVLTEAGLQQAQYQIANISYSPNSK